MTTYVALLRAINVGGNSKVAMSDLRDLLTKLGFLEVQTLLNTGNLVFKSKGRKEADLEQLLESEIVRRLDLRTDIFCRTAQEWPDIIAHNPFPEEAERDPGHLVVMFLKGAPAKSAVEAVRAAISGPELIRVEGRQAYITYPAGIGRSKLTNQLIERRLGVRGTGRNWNTVLKLAELAS